MGWECSQQLNNDNSQTPRGNGDPLINPAGSMIVTPAASEDKRCQMHQQIERRSQASDKPSGRMVCPTCPSRERPSRPMAGGIPSPQPTSPNSQCLAFLSRPPAIVTYRSRLCWARSLEGASALGSLIGDARL
ncbi:hypothetical protein BO94DRAFT_18710 [Aspergillus sclerotioniger CBS 115572]|uniref:Uncharacterized protein n=1 Tax=Aspergillus sclerotioniger CBS 115572 TaxID=1450535 RepID=A0A317XH30_9EURO|nr:hypothetical protein BO94DRAFT_18710 [Aspergillus sclerotioniger CBS 115572]PWY96748.1 hypothetical protein BO94DRAFT_18710 [Aspergillus sclerotioniger CBS 115572]